ncbi:DNA repair protein SWI5 homolog, partial [Lethenteron reissneri]|uniref:DNA repair protein SWI5 homolog n=1 Tax=Lethenteron reissneri TaxID=7753 RepID=UPI002AB68245
GVGSTTPVCRQRPLRRTPQGFSKKLGAKFKSPVPRAKAAATWPGDEESLRCEMDNVRDRTAAVDLEIGQLKAQGCSLDELDVHIRKLHDYNELKDAAQSLLGQLAVLRGITTRDLYGNYGLDVED